MQELKTIIEGRGELKGITFTQLYKSTTAYIYLRSDGYYEVFIHRINTQFDCISYPNSNSFGVWAWTYKNYQDALIKFNSLKLDELIRK